MFRKKLFLESIEPRCGYCARGATLGEGKILCPRKGVVTPGDSCRSFRYDPLRRVPPKPVKLDLSGLKGEDFKL